jgi:DNA-binding NarL/FixJ family response regulator
MRKRKKQLQTLTEQVEHLEWQIDKIEQILQKHFTPKVTQTEKVVTTAPRTGQRSKIITPNRFRAWSEADTLALIDMKAKGLSHRAIGRRLGRSERSIHAKWGVLNRGQK